MKAATTLSLLVLILSVIPASADQPIVAGNGERPGVGQGPTDVEVFLYLIDVIRIDAVDQSFAADLFVMQRWRDPRLAVPGAETRRLPLDSVWNPRLQVLNQRKLELTFPRLVDVEADGTVTYRQRGLGDFAARLDLHDFPLDSHTIGFRIVVPGYGPDEVRLVPSSGDTASRMAAELSVVDWDVGALTVRNEPFEVMPGVRPIGGLTATFEIRRFLGLFVSKAFVSIAIIVLMSFVVFWINPELVAPRMSVAITAMLTLIAYRFLLGSVLPPLPYLTRMDHFLLGSTVLLLVVIIQVAATTHLQTTERAGGAKGLNRVSRWVFPVLFGAIFVVAFWVV